MDIAEDLFGSYEKKRAMAAQLNLMDDIFFSVIMEHTDAAMLILFRVSE